MRPKLTLRVGVALQAYEVLWREWQGSNNNNKKKTTKSMNSRQKTQEYIKGKSPLFIL